MGPPTCESGRLLTRVFGSAEGSTSVRAIVCKGNFFGKPSLACSAANFADSHGSLGEGESSPDIRDECRESEGEESSGLSSSNVRSIAGKVDCVLRMLAIF